MKERKNRIFTIRPYHGAGKMRLGMSPTEIRKLLNTRVESFMKTPVDDFPTDSFPECGVFVFYKGSGICEAIEFEAPAIPVFRSITLLTKSYQDLLGMFRRLDKDLEVDDCGFTSNRYGIGVHAPDGVEEPKAKIESVIVFERGYYDKQEALVKELEDYYFPKKSKSKKR